MEGEGFIDYYEILQLSQRADQETIERVYRLLAKRYHPDNKDTGDAQKFNALSESLPSPIRPRETRWL
jgi:curved DNA-binding protein